MLMSAEAACFAEWFVAKAAFVVVLAEGLVFELAGLAVGELAFTAGFAVFERLVAEVAFATFFTVLAESATAFVIAETLAVFVETAAFFAVFTRSGTWCRTLWWFVGHDAEAGVVAADGHFGQNVQYVLRERFREFDG